MEPLLLSELAEQIKNTINANFDQFYLVTAEILQLNINYSGHAYLQLIEKETGSENIKANLKATIWNNKFRIINAYFKSVTGSDLIQGIKILAKVEVSFHSVYGLSLNIQDIDPAYTLGDVDKQRQQVINRLTSDGVIDMNKLLEFPFVPVNFAVISSPTAAGLGDFMEHLNNNSYGFTYKTQLFEAIMQGENTERSVITALEKINEKNELFDFVVIIRGGGSKLDLAAFDSYELCSNIAQFPLPILTGIGHLRDTSVADIVSHKALKTPTAVADFIIQKTLDFDLLISEKFDSIINFATNLINENEQSTENKLNYFVNISQNLIFEHEAFIINKKSNFNLIVMNFFNYFQNNLFQKREILKQVILKSHEELNFKIDKKSEILKNITLNFLNNQANSLELKNKKLTLLDPENILKLGYSITLKNKKPVKSANELTTGDKITTVFSDGSKNSTIE